MSNCDGTLEITYQTTLVRHIEIKVAPAKFIPLPSACVIDGMSLVNKYYVATIGHLVTLPIAYSCLQSSQEMPVAESTLCMMSIKTMQSKQTELGVEELFGLVHGNIVAGQKIEQWRRQLRSSTSQTSLPSMEKLSIPS